AQPRHAAAFLVDEDQAGPPKAAPDLSNQGTQPWGVILMGRSCKSRDQVRGLIADVHDALGRACLVFIDQEGGRVARLKPPVWPAFPAVRVYGNLYEREPELALRAAWLGHRLLAHELRDVSITANCAPCADVPAPGAHDVIGDRAFSTDAKVVAALVEAALAGLSAGGVEGVVKHIPGHGRALVDSHKSLPRVDADLEALQSDFSPFISVSSTASMGMTAHIAFDHIDPNAPVTLSSKAISDVIRDRIGFEGLLMTDDLSMQALGGALTDRTIGALEAGCDVVLHGAGLVEDEAAIQAEMREVCEASPQLTGAALERAKAAQIAIRQPDAFDFEAGWDELRRLLSGGGAAV
ncbi:MAG: glycoside hydrolase family 3 N-terminal domain-containing protein, partial [Pseudomonadota bacterium]